MNKAMKLKQEIAARFNYDPQQLSESYLRFDIALTSGSSFKWNVNQGDAAVIAGERRLQQNDIFIGTDIAFTLSRVAADSPTTAQIQNRQHFTWPNLSAFSTSNEANLFSLYNGSLSVTVDNVRYLPMIDMRQFIRIPETQQGTTTAAITGPTTYTQRADSYTNGMYGYCPVDYFRLKGTSKNDWTVSLDTSVSIDDTSVTVYGSFWVKGFLGNALNK